MAAEATRRRSRPPRATTAMATHPPTPAPRARSATRSIAKAAIAPPIRPPRWPPIEMPGSRKVMPRLSRISGPMPDCIGSMPRARCITKRGAPSGRRRRPRRRRWRRSGVEQQRAEGAAPAARRSRARRSGRGPATARASCPSQYRTYMLKRMCRSPECRKPAGDQPPVLALGRRAGPQSAKSCERPASAAAAAERAARPRKSSTLIADEHVGDRRLRVHRARRPHPRASGPRTPGSACRPAWPSCSRGRSGGRSSSTRRRSRGWGGGSRWPSRRRT